MARKEQNHSSYSRMKTSPVVIFSARYNGDFQLNLRNDPFQEISPQVRGAWLSYEQKC